MDTSYQPYGPFVSLCRELDLMLREDADTPHTHLAPCKEHSDKPAHQSANDRVPLQLCAHISRHRTSDRSWRRIHR